MNLKCRLHEMYKRFQRLSLGVDESGRSNEMHCLGGLVILNSRRRVNDGMGL